MTVLIKTMIDLPEHCYDCPCYNGESSYCQADKKHRYSIDRPFWCPLLKMSDVLDKIITEIEKTYINITYEENHKVGGSWGLRKALEIINKYKENNDEDID